jgi:hypothetical protein
MANGSIQDFEASGLIDLAAKNYRVMVFDRVLVIATVHAMLSGRPVLKRT